MRVTNNMIMKNAASNINSTKEVVNTKNTQMTSQKKISKPSDDPVVAVRSLRLSTTLSQVNQYYQKNIPDATSWLNVTESALVNMRSAITDCRTLAVNGSTDSLSQTDRRTILKQLQQLQASIYDEGNASYAGRTVFTGYRTNESLTFTEDETETTYDITETVKVGDSLVSRRYYDGDVVVPTTEQEILNNTISDTAQTEYYRIRLAYDKVDETGLNSFTITYADGSNLSFEREKTTAVDGSVTYSYPNARLDLNDANGTKITDYGITVYETEGDWATASRVFNNGELGKTVGDDEIVFIEETGEFIYGKNVAENMMKNDATVTYTYTKTGFEDGELRPEYYYNCIKTNDPEDVKTPVVYTKFDETGAVINFDIEYAVAAGQTLVVNTEASNVFDSDLKRDLDEMINAVTRAIDAVDKVDKINEMLSASQYQSSEDQAKLEEWLAAANKEADYAKDNMQKLYNEEIGNIDTYFAKINLAITDLGCKTDSLKLTKTRMGDQQETVQDLQSQNDDIDLSQIIIEYTAAYTAYQASLTAAGKLGESTLLNYL